MMELLHQLMRKTWFSLLLNYLHFDSDYFVDAFLHIRGIYIFSVICFVLVNKTARGISWWSSRSSDKIFDITNLLSVSYDVCLKHQGGHQAGLQVMWTRMLAMIGNIHSNKPSDKAKWCLYGLRHLNNLLQ
jgi:hypothetical protein